MSEARGADREPVIAVEIGEDVRAYPIRILIWHEIVNDTLAGEPIAVTFCPLCNTFLPKGLEWTGSRRTWGLLAFLGALQAFRPNGQRPKPA